MDKNTKKRTVIYSNVKENKKLAEERKKKELAARKAMKENSEREQQKNNVRKERVIPNRGTDRSR